MFLVFHSFFSFKNKTNRSNTSTMVLSKEKIGALLHSKLVAGALLLTITGIITRFIGFFYKIFLSRTIGAEALGVYQLVFPLFMFSLSICCGGIQTAISRYVAFCDTKKEARLYLYLGMTASILLSVIASVLIYQYAEPISQYFLQEPSCENLLKIMAMAIPPACIHTCINAYYYGTKKASIPAISQLLEQITRVVGVYIIFLVLEESNQPPTAQAAIWGIVIGELTASLFSLTVLRFQTAAGNLIKASKNLLTMGVPLTCNRIALSLAQSLENILIPASLRAFGYSSGDALSLYGILTGMALASVMLPAVLSNSVSVMLLPEISNAQAKRQTDRIKSLIVKTVEFSLILGFACTLLFLFSGNFAGVYLFHNHLAGVYIQILAWICPFLFLGSTLNSVLQGLGKPKTVLAINLTASMIRIGFVVFAIPAFGMRGYLWGALISQIVASGLAYISLKKEVLK